MTPPLESAAGVLLGTACGDALGLPREGLSARRAARLFGAPPLRHRFLLGRGLTSDDTEHTCLLAQALLRHPADAARFARSLGWGLRGWLLTLPAGVGLATLRATLRLLVGYSPEHSGVFSAGNGPAMRAALLGVCLPDLDAVRAYVRASTRLTHTDPRAERGALLVALAARHGAARGAAGVDGVAFLKAANPASWVSSLGAIDAELGGILDAMEGCAARGASVADLAAALGLGRGVGGYVYHTVPVAVYGWLRGLPDPRRVVEDVIALGDDADTTGAIAGALAGATVGAAGLPPEWVAGLAEWPRSVAWMRRVAGRLERTFAHGEAPGPAPLFWPGLLPRNALFLAAVLAHAGRRILPPY